MQIEPQKKTNYMLRKNSRNPPPPPPHPPPVLASPMAILMSNLRVFKAIIIIFPAKTVVQFL